MPLHSQPKALIEMISTIQKDHISNLSVEENREISKNTPQHLRGKKEPVKQVEDRRISTDEGDITIRIYTPFENSTPSPALIYFFGGGFVLGGIENDDTICRNLTNAARCKVISVSYRLAPEHKFPAAPNDAFAVTKWIIQNADELDIDKNRIAVGGYSAGGNLAALTAIRARDEGLSLAYQVLICPCTDLSCSSDSHKEFSEGYILDRKAIDWFYNHYLPANVDPKDPKISLLWEENLKNIPPALIISAEFDPLRDEAKLYAEKLKQVDKDVIYVSLWDGNNTLAFRRTL